MRAAICCVCVLLGCQAPPQATSTGPSAEVVDRLEMELERLGAKRVALEQQALELDKALKRLSAERRALRYLLKKKVVKAPRIGEEGASTHTLSCPEGQMVRALEGSGWPLLEALRVKCMPTTEERAEAEPWQSEVFGGPDEAFKRWECSERTLAEGLVAYVDEGVVVGLRLSCRKTREAELLGSRGGDKTMLDCPEDKVMSGLRLGGTDGIVSALEVVCEVDKESVWIEERVVPRREVLERNPSRTQKVSKSFYEMLKANPELPKDPKYGRPAKILPVYKEGQLSGFRMNSIGRTSFYHEQGWRNGDVVLSVNDKTVKEPNEALRFWEGLDSGPVKVQINRRGRPMTLTYELAE